MILCDSEWQKDPEISLPINKPNTYIGIYYYKLLEIIGAKQLLILALVDPYSYYCK